MNEVTMNYYTLLYVKQINNKDLLYSTGNYIPYFIITIRGKSLKKNMYNLSNLKKNICVSN